MRWCWLLVWCAGLQVSWGAELLRVGFGLHKPPYIFEGLQRGIEYEIVTAAVSEAGWQIDPVYAPQERLHLLLARGEIDAITTTNERSGVKAFYSQPYIHYQNMVGAQRDAVESEMKNELERILYSRGIYVENVLLSEIADTKEFTRIAGAE